jgi:uncharacterized repeat protein (TIGR03803 family)
LVFDATGNLYGTTGPNGYNYGTVYRLTPGTNGEWTETVIYSFNSQNYGDGPYGRLIFDAAGNLYGTTQSGGSGGGGIAFELKPATKGQWTEKILHNFDGKDGKNPLAGLTFDSAGNLYGTTVYGGDYSSSSCKTTGCGVVFQLKPSATGEWTEEVLHAFNFENGAFPFSDLTFDSAGNLYASTWQGGAHGYGIVFELEPGTNDKWSEKILHNFNPNEKDGVLPMTGVIFDGAGNLYGANSEGGAYNSACGERGCGTIFELTPVAKGSWAKKTLLNFDGHDGASPEFIDLCIDAAGNLFGATPAGGYLYGRSCNGLDGCGVAFEITP